MTAWGQHGYKGRWALSSRVPFLLHLQVLALNMDGNEWGCVTHLQQWALTSLEHTVYSLHWASHPPSSQTFQTTTAQKTLRGAGTLRDEEYFKFSPTHWFSHGPRSNLGNCWDF